LFFNCTAPTALHTLSLHDALPISLPILRAGCDIGEVELKPKNFAEAVVIVEALSSSFSFVRVDLYIQDKIYFGELTFTPGNGYIKFLPEQFDRELASKMKLAFKNNG